MIWLTSRNFCTGFCPAESARKLFCSTGPIWPRSSPKTFRQISRNCAPRLPPWTLVIVVSGLVRRPDEKIAYEEKFLKEIVRNEFRKLTLDEALPGFPGLGDKMLSLLRNPWPADVPYWKNRWQGAFAEPVLHRKAGKVAKVR